MTESELNFKVSIVIPVYNGSNYIKGAINSALTQTYKNIEVIVVNDGSIDNTEEIALSFSDRIKYFSKTNGGVASALNLAIQKSEGQYISWLSHDDLYYPNKVERQIEEIRRISPKERGKTIIFSHFDVYYTHNNTRKELPELDNYVSEEPLYTYCMMDVFFRSKLGGCTLLIPRNLFDEIGYFDINHRTIQDYFLFITFLKAGIKYIYITDILVTSRQHEGQGTLKLKDVHFQEANYLFRWAFDLFKEEFQKMPFWQFEHFLNIMKQREFDKVYAYMISEWANGYWNQDKPIIWLYWENKEESQIPDVIRLCWKTIINHNKQDFRIKILTEDDILTYLPNIDKKFDFHEQNAFRADYIRFNLLYVYGGVCLDNDLILFRSLQEIKEKINNYGFVCCGSMNERDNNFPVNCFFASNPRNSVCLYILQKIELFINNRLLKGNQQNSEEHSRFIYNLVKDSLQSLYVYPVEYFNPGKLFSGDNSNYEYLKEIPDNLIYRTNIYSFGQSIANIAGSESFKKYSESELYNFEGIIGYMFKLGYNLNICDHPEKPYNIELNSDQSRIDYFNKRVIRFTNKKLIRFTISRFLFPFAKFFKNLHL